MTAAMAMPGNTDEDVPGSFLRRRPGRRPLSRRAVPDPRGCCHGNWLVSAAGGE